MPALRLAGNERLGKRGFSLIEVVLSVGIVAFSILAILGVLSAGMQSGRESSEDTALALAARYVAAWGRSQPFSTMTGHAEEGTQIPFYFDASGMIRRDANGEPLTAPDQQAHYLCTVSVHPSPVSPHLLALRYRFEWPIFAEQAARQQRTIIASRANEE